MSSVNTCYWILFIFYWFICLLIIITVIKYVINELCINIENKIFFNIKVLIITKYIEINRS